MKTAAIYARAANSEESFDYQLLALRRLAAQMGYEVVEYTDVVSGTKARRPGLDAMMRDARKRKFDVVLVAALDRIARSTRHFLQLVVELSNLDIEFMSQQENIGTTGDLGGQFLAVTRSLLKLQSDLNKELIRAGMRRRKLEGFKLGRPPLDVNHAALVRDGLNGMSLTNVSRKYRLSRASVVRFVREAQRRNMAGVSGFPVGRTQEAAIECVA
jgi:DNA invertase Pin-like site-specific DNA recombinase